MNGAALHSLSLSHLYTLTLQTTFSSSSNTSAMQFTQDYSTDPADRETQLERLCTLFSPSGAISSLYTDAAKTIPLFCDAVSGLYFDPGSKDQVAAVKRTWPAAESTARQINAMIASQSHLLPLSVLEPLMQDRKSYDSAVKTMFNEHPSLYQEIMPAASRAAQRDADGLLSRILTVVLVLPVSISEIQTNRDFDAI